MIVTLIAALGAQNELGKDNHLLWRLPADLKRFKQVTNGHCMIMGRKTFDSIGKALPNRTTIVITRHPDQKIEGVFFVGSLKKAFLTARLLNEKHCFVIGGAQIYRQAIAYADTLDITHIHERFDADVFFPEIDLKKFRKLHSEEHPADENHPYHFSFTTYENMEKRVPALFLDRDGVLNRETGAYITKTEDLNINEGIIPLLKQKQKEGNLLIVITNQGAINKGLLTEEMLMEIHAKLRNEFIKHGVVFDEIYFCPHHSDLSRCLCRKPQSLMLEKAISRFSININTSVMIGDHERDRLCAEGAGVLGIVITPNETAEIKLPD